MNRKKDKSTQDVNGRFNRDRWLAVALETLAREGSARVTVRHLCAQLGVTTGSFYWHFENHEDFVRHIVDFWNEAFTETAARYIRDVSDDPKERLLGLMTILTEQNLGQYDVAIRAWAAQDAEIAKVVRRVDKRRFEVVQGLFLAMGFGQAESDMRARTFLVFHSTEHAIYIKKGKKARLAEMKLRHQFFIRP